jgi:7-carboxy-7-deazaguanine synthase
MYGENRRVVQKEFDTGEALKINEIFRSIQGEGPYAGKPAVFIRLSGCLLGCIFCDTIFEDPKDTYMSVEKIMSEVHALLVLSATENNGLVVITGGEPFAQNIVPLITQLVSEKFEVQVETSGVAFFRREWKAENVEWLVPYRHGIEKTVTFVCSPKATMINKQLLQYIDCYKYVIEEGGTSEVDGLPTYSTQVRNKFALIARPATTAPVYIQPMDTLDETEKAANCAHTISIALKFGYRISLQLHKILNLQ